MSRQEGLRVGLSSADDTGKREDVFFATLLFLIVCVLLQSLLDRAVPGMLKQDTFNQIIITGLIFLALWGLLGRFVFRPYFQLLFERERRTQGDILRAKNLLQESAKVQEELDRFLHQAAIAGAMRRDKLVTEARYKATEKLNAVSAEGEYRLEEARHRIEILKDLTRQELNVEVEKLAEQVIEKALEPSFETVLH